MSRFTRPVRLLASLSLAFLALGSALAGGAHAAPARLVTDPTHTYRISVLTGWHTSADQTMLLAAGPDGNVDVLGMALHEGAGGDPLAKDLPQLPGLLKLGSTTRTSPLKSGILGDVHVQYGIAYFRHSDGTPGELLAIRAYNRGSVVYLVGIIKDSQVSSASADVNAMSAILASAQFS